VPTYDMLISDELVAEFTGTAQWPEGFRIVGPGDGPAGTHYGRFRVQDDNAPAWTEGKLISPVFTNEFEVTDAGLPTGNVSRVTITDWREETEPVTLGESRLGCFPLKPGDAVLVTVGRSLTELEARDVGDRLRERFPGVQFTVMADVAFVTVEGGRSA